MEENPGKKFFIAGLVVVTGTGVVAFRQKAGPVFVDGQAQIVPAFEDQTQWVRHRLWVETEFDSDGDKKRDRVHVDVTRQKQTDTEGLKVPVVYESSPYFAGTSNDRSRLWDVNQELGSEPPPRQSQAEVVFNPGRTSISTSQVNTWVPRGFAVVHSEAPGTGLSTGCPTVGGAPEELAPKAVIDWLNGRAKGYTTVDGAEEVVATWTTGKVGMTGTSYNGTIPLAAATTIDDLERYAWPQADWFDYSAMRGPAVVAAQLSADLPEHLIVPREAEIARAKALGKGKIAAGIRAALKPG